MAMAITIKSGLDTTSTTFLLAALVPVLVPVGANGGLEAMGGI
jgi:hypothetical protein